MINAYRHPWHQKLFDDWDFYRLSYEGGMDYIKQHLFSHPKEGAKYYARRLVRAIYPNHTRVIVDTYASQLYKNPVPRSADTKAEALLTELWADMDLAGTGADDFYEDVVQKAQIYGYVAIVIDRFEPEVAPMTRAEELKSGRRPYAYCVTPEDIVDWRVDSRGRLEWVMLRETLAYARDFDQPYGELEFRYRRWTRGGWELYQVDSEEDEQGVMRTHYKLLDEGQHPVGRVPVEFVYFGKRKAPDPVAESLIKDIAPLTRRLLNLISLVDEQIYQYVFNIMVLPESTWEELEKIDFSVAGSIPVADDTSVLPFYLSPDVSQIEAIQRQIEATVESIRFLSGLGRQNEASRQSPSGLALAYQTSDKRALVSKLAQTMADVEARVDEAVLAWMEIHDAEVVRSYDIELEPGEVEQALEDAMAFASLGITGQAALENAIQAVKAHLGKRTTPERLQEIIQELQENPQLAGISGGYPPPTFTQRQATPPGD